MTGKTVYLAAVTSDIQTGREKLMRELSDRGHRFCRIVRYPHRGDEFT